MVCRNISQESKLQLHLKTNLRTLIKKKAKKENHTAVLSYANQQGEEMAWNIKVRARGNMRNKICFLPPLKIDFSKTDNLWIGTRNYHLKKLEIKESAIVNIDLFQKIRGLKAQTKPKFEEGITHYFNRQFGKAAECFKQVLAVHETDMAAQYYLDKSVGYIVNEVAEDWSGVEEMVMK